jgi:hypothetical protein
MKFALLASLLLCLVSIVDAQTFKKHAVNVAWTHDSLYAALQADACIVVGTVRSGRSDTARPSDLEHRIDHHGNAARQVP